MHCCLIEPPKFVSLTNAVSTVAMPPIGPAYLAAALRAAGHRVTLIDAAGAALEQRRRFGRVSVRGLRVAEIVAGVPADAELLGVSCMFTSHWPLVRTLLEALRARCPAVPLVLGGEHVTGLPEFSFAQAPIDYAVLGEGEETLVALADALAAGRDPRALAGLAGRGADGRPVVNPRRARITDIDALPEPAWDLVDVEAYMAFNQPHGAARGRFMPMLATRGCPFQCTFCTSPNMWTTRWTARDPTLVVDEMERYHRRYGAVDFQFEDLTAIVRRQWVLDFCDELLRRGLQITFQLPSGTRSEALDYEVARQMKAAGCHEFAFAPESGDPRILKAIKKKVQLPRLYEAVRQTRRAGINVGCFFIIGFPEEDFRSVLRTWRAIARVALLGATHVNVNAYSPQPATESFAALRRRGLVRDLDDEYLFSLFTFQDYGARKKSYNPRFRDVHVTAFVVIGTALFYVLSFLVRPQRLLRVVFDLFARGTANRTNKVLRSITRELWRAWRGRPAADEARYSSPSTRRSGLSAAPSAARPSTNSPSARPSQ